MKEKVVLALSGGVDSLSAALFCMLGMSIV